MDETDPALSKTPKYIFDANEAVAIDAGFALRGEAAFVSRVLDLQLAEHLITRSSWRGRGFATIVSPAVTSSLTDVAAIVLHELCHWYDHGAKVGPVSNAVERSRQLIRMMRDCAKPDPKPATQQSPAPALPTWHNHGLGFVRAGCHVAYRVARRLPSIGITPDKIRFASGYYGKLTERDFMSALSRELTTRSHESIGWILKSPAPKQFSDLWHSATGTKPKPKPPTVRRFDGKLVVMRATVADAPSKDGGLVVTLADETFNALGFLV